MGGDQGVVIDEEELALLRELKDLKRSYREHYDRLKQAKVTIADAQANVDGMKQQMVLDFERWYSEEFDVGDGLDGVGSTLMTYGAGGGTMLPNATGDEVGMADEEAEAYLRAKRNVDTLHRAKKLEKMRPGGYKK